MLQLTDFKPGDTAYIYYKLIGYNKPPEIIETKVEKVGRKYVTVRYGKRFKRHGNIYGLLQDSDYGERGILFNSKNEAETEKKRDILIRDIRKNINYLEKLSFDDLKTIMSILKGKADES